MTTVTTPAVAQAMLGGILLRHGCSLREYVRPKLGFYRSNRDRMLARLAESFRDLELGGQVRWNRPRGGFFLTVTLPFSWRAVEKGPGDLR